MQIGQQASMSTELAAGEYRPIARLLLQKHCWKLVALARKRLQVLHGRCPPQHRQLQLQKL